MREKTLLKKLVETMNSGSLRYILEALAVFNSLKNIIQMETQNPFINFSEILDDKNDKRYHFAHALNLLERHVIRYIDAWTKKESELPKVKYESWWARNKELRAFYTRPGRKLYKKIKKGKINPDEFHEKSQKLEKEGRLFKLQKVQKDLQKRSNQAKSNFVDASEENTDNEKFTACKANIPTKISTEGNDLE